MVHPSLIPEARVVAAPAGRPRFPGALSAAWVMKEAR